MIPLQTKKDSPLYHVYQMNYLHHGREFFLDDSTADALFHPRPQCFSTSFVSLHILFLFLSHWRALVSAEHLVSCSGAKTLSSCWQEMFSQAAHGAAHGAAQSDHIAGPAGAHELHFTNDTVHTPFCTYTHTDLK